MRMILLFSEKMLKAMDGMSLEMIFSQLYLEEDYHMSPKKKYSQ